MADFLNKLGIKPGSGEDLGKAAAGALGGIFGQKVKPGVDQAAGAATGAINDVANAGANWIKIKGIQVVISTQYPDALPLDKSKGMTQFVENGLSALGHFAGKPDGKADGKTLDAINKLREGKEPLTSADQFSKADLKLLIDKLAEAKDNRHAQNVLGGATDTLAGLKKDYPKPETPTPQPAGQDPSNGG